MVSTVPNQRRVPDSIMHIHIKVRRLPHDVYPKPCSGTHPLCPLAVLSFQSPSRSLRTVAAHSFVSGNWTLSAT